MRNGWEIKKLGEVCLVERGSSPRPIEKYQTDSPNGVNWIKIGDTKGIDKYIYSTKEKITKEGAKKSRYVKQGDFILSNSMSFGKPFIMKTDGYIHDGWFVLRLHKFIDTEYFFHLLSSPNVQEQIHTLAAGAIVKNISGDLVKRVNIAFPALPEQKRIVTILDEAFAAIDKAKANAEKNLQNAKELFYNYLHSIVTSQSNGWEIKKLGEVAEYFNGLTYSPKDVSNEGIIVLRSSNVQNDELDFSDIVRVALTVKDKIIVKDGDILMCSRNGSKRLVGKTATIKNLKEVMTFGTFMMIIRSQYNPYLAWFFKSNDFRKQISGGENTMINQITRYMLDDVVLSFPPIKTQE